MKPRNNCRFVSLGGNTLSLVLLPTLVIEISAMAQGNTNGVAAPPASQGLLPIPDYTGDFWARSYLTCDWDGLRTELASKGIQFGVEWDQYVQAVTAGGRDRTVVYGGGADYTINLDLMRMGVLPGALVKFRAESRYGRSVNGVAGAILPVNTDALFPLTEGLDDDVGFTITDLNYTQFLSKHLGVVVGKLDTLDGDPNEFASGRGTGQFMNANFVFNPTLALRLPYSTLGVGVVWMPVPVGTNGGITVTSLLFNTADSSTTTGFEDFGKGTSSYTEADFQYRLGGLPGGMNLGFLYSFDQDFAQLNSRLIFQPGEGFSIPSENSTWAAFWSGWQYLFVCETERRPINLLDGRADEKGVGVFARFGVADKDTNPVEWAISGGVGGRGILPTRDNDTFGIGYYYNRIERIRLSSVLGVENSAQGFECFYNIAVTPAAQVALDVQVVDSVSSNVRTATVLGMRARLTF